MDIKQLVRKNILNLKPYSSARSEFKGEASVFIDANENPFRESYNRYPDPLQKSLKKLLSAMKSIGDDNIFLGNGSDEAIDLVFRIFCEPRVDNVIIPDPTYGMYEVCANINDVQVKKILLEEDFSLCADKILAKADNNTKAIFICTPNNPSGNLFEEKEILKILNTFHGIVVIDEAYIDFTDKDSWLTRLKQYPHMIILQTLSKAWGLAALRLGMAFASSEIIQYFNAVKYPYNINQLTQEYVIEALKNVELKDRWVGDIVSERKKITDQLLKYPFIERIYPSDANYILIKTKDANKLYNYLTSKGIIVRNRNTQSLCEGCLRITIGNNNENIKLIDALDQFI